MINKSTLVWLSLVVVAGFGLLQLKYRVQGLEEQLAGVNRAIEDDRAAMQVLRAEWSYLNEPSRIERLSREHLGLTPVGTDQIRTVGAIPMRKPAATVPDLPVLQSAEVDPGTLLPTDMTAAPSADAPSLAALPGTE